MKNISVQTLLDWLENQGVLSQRNTAQAYLLCKENIDHIPVYVHILIGFGAFIGCWSAVGLLYASGFVNWQNDLSLIITGLIGIGLAIITHYALKNSNELLHSFSLQLSCILMMLGKVLFIFGMLQKLHLSFPAISESWLATLSIAIVVIPTYFIFPVLLDRFISTLVLLTALLGNTYFDFHHNIAFYGYYVALLALVGWLLNDKYKHYALEAFTYAGIITLGFCAIILSNLLAFHSQQWLVPTVVFNITLSIAIILQCLTLNLNKPLNHLTFWSSCIGLLLLGIISTNGIIYGIGLLILGYEKHRRELIILGIVFLSLFIIEYYYNLSLNLAQKAAILAGSGGLLLVVRMVLQHEQWDKMQ
jgi:hypothetical protein